MRKVALCSLAVLAFGCGPSPDAQLPNLPGLKGGRTASGGVSQSGGSTSGGSGGSLPKGSGGAGGKGSAGDTPGSGGTKEGTGGRTTGGRTGGDAGVEPRRDGPRGTGGVEGDGGTTSRDAGRGASGGNADAGRDLFIGRDVLIPGTGGIGGRDAPSVSRDAIAASCYAIIVDNGYACGTAAPCSACKDQNGTAKEAECQKGIDCLAAAGASCDNNCQLGCLNKAGDSTVHTCIKALTTAACNGTGC